MQPIIRTHRSCSHFAALLVVAFSLLTLGPAASRAAAPASVADPAGDNGPGAATDITRVEVAWDGATLGVRLTYVAPRFTNVSFAVTAAVDFDDPGACADAGDWMHFEGSPQLMRVQASFLVSVLEAAGSSWASNQVTYLFSSPALTAALNGGADPFVCLGGNSDHDGFFGAFEGRTLALTEETATAAVQAELARHFGERFSSSLDTWIACPEAEIDRGDGSGVPVALTCQFEFSEDGLTYRGGIVDLELVRGTLSVGDFRSRTFTKGLVACSRIRRNLFSENPMVLNRRLSSSGWLGCTDPPDSVFRDLHRKRPGIRRVTDSYAAGYDAKASFRCRLRRRGARYTANCENERGDGFRYAYTLRRKPKPNRGGGGGTGGGDGNKCDPNYSGACLDPNAPDYDCRGGSGDGPLFTGRVRVVGDDHYDLDRNGDGIACED